MTSLTATALPEDAAFYKGTGTFTQDIIPAGLRKDHATKAGVLGLIKVESGCLLFCGTDPRRNAFEIEVGPDDTPILIEPTWLHHVVPIGAVRFHVEFYRV